METRIYRYRRAATVTLPAFLTFWSVGWLVGLVRKGPHGPVRINGRPGTPEQAVAFFWGFLLIGLPIACLAARLMLGWLNERVEVHADEIVWFDWRGRERARIRLDSVMSVRLGSNPFMREGFAWWAPQGRPLSHPIESMTIRAEACDIPVSGTLEGYEELKALAMSAWASNATRRGVGP